MHEELRLMNDNIKELKNVLAQKPKGKPDNSAADAEKEKMKADAKVEEAKIQAKTDELAEKAKAKLDDALRDQEAKKREQAAVESKNADLSKERALDRMEAAGARKAKQAEQREELKEEKADAAKKKAADKAE